MFRRLGLTASYGNETSKIKVRKILMKSGDIEMETKQIEQL